MKRGGVVPLLLGDAHLDGYGGQLDHLRAVVADDVAADDPVALGVDHQLHQGAVHAAIEGRLHRAERRLVDVHLAILVARLRLAEAHHAHRRLGEDRARHGIVVIAGRVAPELGLGEGGALADRNRRQVDAVGDIADGPDVLDVGARPFVDLDGALVVELDPGGVQPEATGLRGPARGEHDHLGSDVMAIVQVADQAVRRLLDPVVLAAEDDLDPPLLHLAREMGAHVVVEAAQDVGAPVHQGGVDPQPLEDAGELDGDVAAAHDHDALGQGRQMEGLVGGDGVFGARHIGLHRPAADGDQDLLGREGLVLANQLDRVGVLQLGAGVGEFGAGVR